MIALGRRAGRYTRLWLVNPGDALRIGRERASVAAAIAVARRSELNLLWVGDSHASFFAGLPLTRFAVDRRGGQAVVWLGPRLMFSLARDGFPEPLLPELRRGLDLTGTTVVACAGEIDCRVHLGLRLGESLDFVSRYVSRVGALRDRLRAPHAVIVGPVPPSDAGLVNDEFPRTGTLEQRGAATVALEQALEEAVVSNGDERVALLTLSSHLAASTSTGLLPSFDLDGCHVNPAGAEVVRAGVTRILDPSSARSE